MEAIFKIGLAILLFLCLLDWPYGYFQFVRFIAMVSFAYLAFKANENGNQKMVWIYGFLAVLFQPLIKIALGRELWNIVDVVVGIGLLVSLIKMEKSE